MAPRLGDSYHGVHDGTSSSAKKSFADEHKNDYERDDSDVEKEFDLFAQEQHFDKVFSLKKAFTAARQQESRGAEMLPSYLPFDMQQKKTNRNTSSRVQDRLNYSASSLLRDVSETLMTLEDAEQVLGSSCPDLPGFSPSKDDDGDIFDQLEQRLSKNSRRQQGNTASSKAHSTRERRSIPLSPEPTMKPSINALVTPRRTPTSRRTATGAFANSYHGHSKALELATTPTVFANLDKEAGADEFHADRLMHQSCPVLVLSPTKTTNKVRSSKASQKSGKSSRSDRGNENSNSASKALQLPPSPFVFSDLNEDAPDESKDALLMHESCPVLDLSQSRSNSKVRISKNSQKSAKTSRSNGSGSSKENKNAAAPQTPRRSRLKSTVRDLVLGSSSEHKPSKSVPRTNTEPAAPETPRKSSSKTLGLNSSCSDILATPSAPRSKLLRGRALSPSASRTTKLSTSALGEAPATPTSIKHRSNNHRARSRSLRQQRRTSVALNEEPLALESASRRSSTHHSHHHQLTSSNGEAHPRKAQRSSSKTRSRSKTRSSSANRRSSSQSRRQQQRRKSNTAGLNASVPNLTSSPDQLASSHRRVTERRRQRASAGHDLLVRNIDNLKNTKTSETSTALAAPIKADVWEKRAARQRNRTMLQP